MRLGLDCDGVLRDFVGQLVKVYKEEYPNHVVKPVTSWSLEGFFPIGTGIYEFAFNHFSKEIFLGADAYSNVARDLRKLKSLGHTIHILTYQNRQTAFWTHYWFYVYRFPIDEFRVWIDHQDTDEDGKEKTDYDVYLDDSPTNLRKFVEEGKVTVRMIRPWNEPIDGLSRSVNNLTEFIDFVESMKE